MKLELKHIAPYLPYGLQIRDTTNDIDWTLDAVKDALYTLRDNEHICIANFFSENMDKKEIIHKPILRPLSDYKEVVCEKMGDLNIDILDQIRISEFANGERSLDEIFYSTYIIMLENHIDIFGLIDAGLAISKNEI